MLTSDPWSRGPFYSFSCRASSAERKPTTSKHTAAPVRWLAALVQKAIWIDARRKAPVFTTCATTTLRRYCTSGCRTSRVGFGITPSRRARATPMISCSCTRQATQSNELSPRNSWRPFSWNPPLCISSGGSVGLTPAGQAWLPPLGRRTDRCIRTLCRVQAGQKSECRTTYCTQPSPLHGNIAASGDIFLRNESGRSAVDQRL